METLTFKTSLKCNGCIAAVKPSLDAIEGVISWEVDLTASDGLLKAEVESRDISGQVISALRKSGYEADEL